jgi:hypothetical protein
MMTSPHPKLKWPICKEWGGGDGGDGGEYDEEDEGVGW